MKSRARTAAWTMLTAYAVWQVGALLHLVLSVHVVLPDGSIGEIDPASGEPVPERDADPFDDGCPVMSQLTAASAEATDTGPIVVSQTEAIAEEVPAEEAPQFVREEIYLVSPSNSPPAGC